MGEIIRHIKEKGSLVVVIEGRMARTGKPDDGFQLKEYLRICFRGEEGPQFAGVVIDLSRVEYIDGNGLAQLIFACIYMQAAKGEIVFVEPKAERYSGFIKQYLPGSISPFEAAFFKTRSEAIQALQTGQPNQTDVAVGKS